MNKNLSTLLVMPLALSIFNGKLKAEEKNKVDYNKSVKILVGGAYNSEQGLNSEHKENFTKSKDISALTYVFGLEAGLKAFGLWLGVGFNYCLSKKVNSIDADGKNWGFIERQNMQIYDIIEKSILERNLWEIGGVIKPGITRRKRIQNFDGKDYTETMNSFSLPIGAYFEIGKQIAGQLQTLYDPVTRQFNFNIGGVYKFSK